MTQTERSPLARLVLFMICLSVAGTILAGGHYLAVDLPQQKAFHPPANVGNYDPIQLLGPAVCTSKCPENDEECWRDCLSN